MRKGRLPDVFQLLTKLVHAASPSQPMFLQIVQWQKEVSLLAVKNVNWYTYDPSVASWRQVTGRILGGKTATVVTVSIGDDLIAPTGTDTTTADNCKGASTALNYKVSSAPFTSTLLQQISGAVGAISGALAVGNAISGIQVAVTSNVRVMAPANIEIVSSADANTVNTIATNISDQKFVNERLYPVGLSFPVAVNSFKDVTWNSTSSTASPITQQRTNVYAAIDFYPLQTNLSSAKSWPPVPHPLVALPISGRPLQHSMLAIALPVYVTEIYAGAVFNEDKIPLAGALQTHWVVKLAFGINVSVSQIGSLISKATK